MLGGVFCWEAEGGCRLPGLHGRDGEAGGTSVGRYIWQTARKAKFADNLCFPSGDEAITARAREELPSLGQADKPA